MVDDKSSTPAVSHARAQNDFGTNLWVRQGTVEHRHPTAGRGLFAGLQDTKKYNVDHGWAKRNADASTGLAGWLWNKYVAPISG
ncbi:hypothetical protein BDW72DRAFT_192301 [Aspergillus terricola var. indicus]